MSLSVDARTRLVRVDPVIKSAYDSKGRTGSNDRTALQSLRDRKAGYMTPDAVLALSDLHMAVSAAGGDFRVTDCLRDLEEQTAARAKYDAWLAAGRPARFDTAIMKSAFVARPGRSFHNAGRAIDVDIASLKFPGVSPDHQLDKLWEIALPRGWRPAIKLPDEEAKEAWHFDFMGADWSPVYARIGYEWTAICAVLDIGEWSIVLARERIIQANLQRAGYSIGDIDGLIGRRCVKALGMAGITATARAQQFTAALALPSSSETKLVA